MGYLYIYLLHLNWNLYMHLIHLPLYTCYMSLVLNATYGYFYNNMFIYDMSFVFNATAFELMLNCFLQFIMLLKVTF